MKLWENTTISEHAPAYGTGYTDSGDAQAAQTLPPVTEQELEWLVTYLRDRVSRELGRVPISRYDLDGVAVRVRNKLLDARRQVTALTAECDLLRKQLARSIQTPPTDPLGPEFMAVVRDPMGQAMRVVAQEYEWSTGRWWITLAPCTGGIPRMVRDTDLAQWDLPPTDSPR